MMLKLADVHEEVGPLKLQATALADEGHRALRPISAQVEAMACAQPSRWGNHICEVCRRVHDDTRVRKLGHKVVGLKHDTAHGSEAITCTSEVQPVLGSIKMELVIHDDCF